MLYTATLIFIPSAQAILGLLTSSRNEIAMISVYMQTRSFNLLVKTVFTAILILSATVTQSMAKDGASIHWESSYEVALKKALKKNNPVVVYLYMDGCDGCKAMDVKTLSDSEVIRFSRGQVYVRLNVAEGSTDSELAEQFNITTYPAILIVNGHGKEIARIDGPLSPEDYVSLMYCSLRNDFPNVEPPECTRSEAQDIKKYLLYGKQKYESYEFERATKVFERIGRIDPENNYGTTDRALLLLGVCYVYLGQIQKGGTVLTRLIDQFPGSITMPDANYILGQVYLQQGRQEEAKSLFLTVVKKYSRHIFAPEAQRALEQPVTDSCK